MKPTRYSFIAVIALVSFLTIGNAKASGAKLPVQFPADESAQNVEGESESTGSTNTTSPQGPVVVNDNFSHLDPENIVPKALLSKALKYYESNPNLVKNKEVIGVIDFSQHSSKERFYIIDMQSGRVETYQTAHGKNSDPDHDGYATLFSNTPGSNMSSQGIYLTSTTYEGGHGYSLLLDGKSTTNSNARSRAIVIHPADYVQAGVKSGRSWGCPALDPRFSEEVIDKIKNGAVIYAQ